MAYLLKKVAIPKESKIKAVTIISVAGHKKLQKKQKNTD